MKKLLLITAMFMAMSVWSEIEIVEQKDGLTVYCISNLIVIQNQSGGMIHLMKSKGKRGFALGGDAGIPVPMSCRDYE